MDLIRTMEAEFKRIKANREWSVEYMTLYMKFQEQKRESYDQGWADGEAQAQATYAEREAAYSARESAYLSRIAELESRSAMKEG